VLEHHHDQSEAVVELLHRSGLNNAAAHFDLEGVKRFACAQHTT
jgi:release factor glutamine methyltransferase